MAAGGFGALLLKLAACDHAQKQVGKLNPA
jgi:hypothetical protein